MGGGSAGEGVVSCLLVCICVCVCVRVNTYMHTAVSRYIEWVCESWVRETKAKRNEGAIGEEDGSEYRHGAGMQRFWIIYDLGY